MWVIVNSKYISLDMRIKFMSKRNIYVELQIRIFISILEILALNFWFHLFFG